MTFPDPSTAKPFGAGSDPSGAENTQDVIPPTERNKDPLEAAQSNDLTAGNVEPKAEDRADPIAERVYAPASERVPKAPVPGHREVIEHTDTHTPEREAAASDTRPTAGSPSYSYGTSASTTPGAYGTNPGFRADDFSNDEGGRRKVFMGLGFSWVAVIGTAIAVWLFMRWRAERNKPINRLRRQARQALEVAEELRGRVSVPSAEDAARPAAGIGGVLVPLLLLLWRQSQQQSREDRIREQLLAAAGRGERMGRQADKAARRAAQSMTEVDWQTALAQLKERWNPSRIELEKVQISKK